MFCIIHKPKYSHVKYIEGNISTKQPTQELSIKIISKECKYARKNVVRNIGTNTEENQPKEADASTHLRTLLLGGETNTSLSVHDYLSRYSQLRTIFIQYADALQFFSPH
jgi:hypothetical protein